MVSQIGFDGSEPHGAEDPGRQGVGATPGDPLANGEKELECRWRGDSSTYRSPERLLGAKEPMASCTGCPQWVAIRIPESSCSLLEGRSLSASALDGPSRVDVDEAVMDGAWTVRLLLLTATVRAVRVRREEGPYVKFSRENTPSSLTLFAAPRVTLFEVSSSSSPSSFESVSSPLRLRL